MLKDINCEAEELIASKTIDWFGLIRISVGNTLGPGANVGVVLVVLLTTVLTHPFCNTVGFPTVSGTASSTAISFPTPSLILWTRLALVWK